MNLMTIVAILMMIPLPVLLWRARRPAYIRRPGTQFDILIAVLGGALGLVGALILLVEFGSWLWGFV